MQVDEWLLLSLMWAIGGGAIDQEEEMKKTADRDRYFVLLMLRLRFLLQS